MRPYFPQPEHVVAYAVNFINAMFFKFPYVKTNFWVIIFFVGILALLVIVYQKRLIVLDRLFVYFPTKDSSYDYSLLAEKYEEIFFETRDGLILHGVFLEGESNLTVILFHGNAGNIGDRLEYISLMSSEIGVNVFLFDYRGYGLSQGTPSEFGLYMDAQAAVDLVLARMNSMSGEDSKIILFGRSLGSSVALKMAGMYQPSSVIIEAPFTSITDLSRKTYPYIPAFIIKNLIRARYESSSMVADISCPLMVIHGDQDSIVPIGMGKHIYDLATVEKDFYKVERAGHNDTYIVAGSEYFGRIGVFIESKSERSQFE